MKKMCESTRVQKISRFEPHWDTNTQDVSFLSLFAEFNINSGMTFTGGCKIHHGVFFLHGIFVPRLLIFYTCSG